MTKQEHVHNQPGHAIFIGSISIILSLLVPILLVNTTFPFFGISLALLLMLAATLYLKPEVGRSDWILSGIVISSTLLTVLRTNPFMVFMLYSSAIYSLSLLMSRFDDVYRPYLLPFAPLLVLAQVIGTHKPYRGYGMIMSSVFGTARDSIETADATKILKGIVKTGISFGIGIFLLIILSAILASANVVFASYFSVFFIVLADALINIFKILGIMNGLVFVRILFSVLLLLVFPLILTSITMNKLEASSVRITPEKLLKFAIPKSMVILLFSVFIISQLQLYTASIDDLVELGLSARERINEVFGQLAWATLISFSLLFFDTAKSNLAKALSFTLITLSIVLAGFALQNDVYYISEFGLSSKRIWGLMVIVWLAVIAVILTIKNLKTVDHLSVLKYASISTFVLVIISGWINFDAQIYAYNRDSMIEEKTYNLVPIRSADSRHLSQIISIYEEDLGVKDKDFEEPDYSSEFVLRDKYRRYQAQADYAEYLKGKYCQRIPLLSFNLSEYREAVSIC